MESREYKFRLCRRVIYLGIIHILLALALGYVLYTLYDGDYISVWFTSVVVAYISLLTLSIPRRIIVTPESITIRCILEIKEMKISDIVKIRRVPPRSLRWIIPLFSSWGFFGYYGKYFDLRRAEKVYLYASEWSEFIEIVDIYDDRYYISCRECEELTQNLKRCREEV